MDSQHPIDAEITRRQAQLLADLAALIRPQPPSPGPGPRPAPAPASPGLAPSPPMPMPDSHYHRGHFGPQHGLTPAQAWEAEQLLRRANARRPITGKHAQQRRARRIQGIISALRNGRTGNAAWGRSMLGKRGGNVMRDHALGHLRAIARVGGEAAKAARERKKALETWERTGGQGVPLTTHETGQRPLLKPHD